MTGSRTPRRDKRPASAVPDTPPRCFIVTHQQADLDGFASMLAACRLHPGCVPVLPDGASADLRRFLRAMPALAQCLLPVEEVDVAGIERLILVDCRQAERLGPLRAAADNPQVHVITYDHHPPQPGDIARGEHVGGETGANATLLVERLRAKGVALAADEATALALGIFEDTGSLTYAGMQPRDLYALAWLLEQGADLVFVGRFLRQVLSSAQIGLLDGLLHNLRVVRVDNHEILLSAVLTDEYVDDAAQVVSRLFDMQQPDAVFALVGQGSRVAVIARSGGNGGLPIHGIMQRLGGGGHPMAASVTLHQMTLSEAEEQVLNAIYLGLSSSLPRARDFMTRVVHGVQGRQTIAEGLEALARYPHRGLPVLDDQGRPQGYVDRRLLENARRHGLAQRCLADYAEPLHSVPLEGTLLNAREALSRSLVPMLGVVERTTGVLHGILSSADLHRLESMHSLPLPKSSGPRNLSRRMQALWGAATSQRLRQLGEEAMALGMRAYLIGGSVRDLLMNRPGQDIDVVIEGEAIRLAEHLRAQMPDVRITLHPDFGTATIIYSDGGRLDLASSRVEHYTAPASLPVVELGGIHADLWRRDFAMNAMALDMHPTSFGHLLDPYRGSGDIKARRIRVLHSLSFVEDPTRLLRALRFEARLDFRMDEQTARLAMNAVHLGIFDQLSGPRLWRELRYLLDLPQFGKVLDRLAYFHLWTVLRGVPVKDPRLLHARFCHALDMMRWYHLLFRPRPARHWAALLRILLADLDQADLKSRLAYFRLPAREADQCLGDIHHMQGLRQALIRASGRWERHVLLSRLGLEGLLAGMALVEDESLRAHISEFIQHEMDLDLPLTGHDLIALGVAQGPAVGQWLERLRRALVEGEIAGREQAKAWLTERLRQVAAP